MACSYCYSDDGKSFIQDIEYMMENDDCPSLLKAPSLRMKKDNSSQFSTKSAYSPSDLIQLERGGINLVFIIRDYYQH